MISHDQKVCLELYLQIMLKVLFVFCNRKASSRCRKILPNYHQSEVSSYPTCTYNLYKLKLARKNVCGHNIMTLISPDEFNDDEIFFIHAGWHVRQKFLSAVRCVWRVSAFILTFKSSQVCLNRACLLLSHRALASTDVRMVILDMSLPTGFTPENSDLEMVISPYKTTSTDFTVTYN